jgi:major type 1 subunit fimbrin (pilin)
MKIRFLALASAALLAGQAAQASDGTLTFNGQLTDSTCTITGGGNKTITLPTLSRLSVNGAGTTGGDTYFTIALTGCTAGLSTANTYFEAGANIDTTNGRLKNTAVAGATNVQIELLNKNGVAVNLAAPSGGQNTIAESISASNAASQQFIARYYATGTTTSGLVSSSVTYSMIYN